jgi:hypothetical protein
VLGEMGLSFDAWLYFHQIPELTALARAFPQLPIVLNHCGGVLGIGRYAQMREEVWTRWQAAIAELATCPNVMVKLGGLGMRLPGFGLEEGATAPDSVTLAAAWRPCRGGTRDGKTLQVDEPFLLAELSRAVAVPCSEEIGHVEVGSLKQRAHFVP